MNSPAYVGYSRTPNGKLNYVGRYQITFSGNYVPVTGETVNLLNATNPNGVELNGALPVPPGSEVDTVAENIGGYRANVSNYANGSFQVNILASGGVELAAGAYPAAISGGSMIVAIPFQR